MRLLHISLNTTYSECKPSSSISFFTYSLQVFLPLPAHLTSVITTFLQADTQSSPFLRSTCPNKLNLPCLTTSATRSTPKRLYKSTLHFLCLATPRTSISPSSVPSSRDFADLQLSLPRFQSYMSIHSGHKPCISFPLCGMMHPDIITANYFENVIFFNAMLGLDVCPFKKR